MARLKLFAGQKFPNGSGLISSKNKSGGNVRPRSKFEKILNPTMILQRKILKDCWKRWESLDIAHKRSWNSVASHNYKGKWNSSNNRRNGFNLFLSCFTMYWLHIFYYNGVLQIKNGGDWVSYSRNDLVLPTYGIELVDFGSVALYCGAEGWCKYRIIEAEINLSLNCVEFSIEVYLPDDSPRQLQPMVFSYNFRPGAGGFAIYTSVPQSSEGSRYSPLNRLVLCIMGYCSTDDYPSARTKSRVLTFRAPLAKYVFDSSLDITPGNIFRLSFFALSWDCGSILVNEIDAKVI